MNKPKQFSINISVYNFIVDVYVSDDQKKLNRINNMLLERRGFPKEKVWDAGASCYNKWLDNKGFNRYSILFRVDSVCPGHIAHEVFHLTSMSLSNLGMELTDSSEEAYAYMIGYLTETLHRELKDYYN